MLSHRALLSHLHSIASFKIIDGDSVVLAMLPLFHVFGLNAVLGSWAASGARLVIMDGLTASPRCDGARHQRAAGAPGACANRG